MPLLREQDTFQVKDSCYKSKGKMNYSVQINVQGNQKSLLECLSPEGIKKERSHYLLKKIKNGVRFDIKAKDATALRATVNMITQLLAVYEKMSRIK